MARSIKVDTSGLEQTRKDLTVGRLLILGRLGERGYKHLRDEVPKQTRNLMQGVAPPDIDKQAMRATLTVSARSARTGPRSATVHYPSGKRKQIMLRPTQSFNYAEVVARGRPAIFPKLGKAILIPVLGAPSDEAYITEGGNIYVVRRSAGPAKANPFDERAAVKLEAEAPAVAGAVFGELFT
jgi:hypothetical protein